MAEIPLQRKSGGKGWVWALLALAVLALLAWWFFSNTRTTDTTAVAAGEVAPAAGTNAGPAAPGGATTGAPVAAFLTWVDQARTRAEPSVDHEYVSTGIERLSGAIADLAVRDSIGGQPLAEQVGALNALAVRVRQDPEALTHAEAVRSAFTASAALLSNIQQRRFPGGAGAVADVRAAAQAITGDRPLLDQQQQVVRFFDQAAAAVRAMSA